VVGAGMVICLERGADLHIAQLMPLPVTDSCFSKIQIGFTFLVPADLGIPGKGPLNGCVSVCVAILMRQGGWKKFVHMRRSFSNLTVNYIALDAVIFDEVTGE